MSIIDGYIKANEEALGLVVQDNAELGVALSEFLAALSTLEKEADVTFADEEEQAIVNRISDLERQAQAIVQSEPIDVAKEIAEIERAKAASEAEAKKKPETALEWLEELPDPIRSLAVSYAQSPESSLTPNMSAGNLSDAIDMAFNFTSTDEGYLYWSRVRRLLRDGADPKDLPLPDGSNSTLPDPAPSAPPLSPVRKPAPVKRNKKQQKTTNTDIVTAEDLEQLEKLSRDETVEISDDDLIIDDDFLDDLDLDDI